MADLPRRPATVARFDRVARPQAVGRRRDVAGKQAIYSTAPDAPPTTLALVICERCDIEAGIDLRDVPAMLWPPPVLFNPLTRKLLARCPSCRTKAWLLVRQGQALRALLLRR